MIIPEQIYRLVESKLKDRWMLVVRANQALFVAQAQAVRITASAFDAIPVHGGAKDSPAEKAALRVIQAEDKLHVAEKWQDAFAMTDKAFPWESTAEGVLAGYLYGNGMNLADAARAAGCSRKTAMRLRDNYVGHCALFAASMGLITFGRDKDADANG